MKIIWIGEMFNGYTTEYFTKRCYIYYHFTSVSIPIYYSHILNIYNISHKFFIIFNRHILMKKITNYKHGGSSTKLNRVWRSMKQRILNQNDSVYKDYGGRGIKVYDKWLEFIPFRDWALSNGYSEGLQINRINNNGNYEPNNCNWITNEKNSQNKRNIVMTIYLANEIRFKYNSGYYTQRQLSKEYMVSTATICNIINNKSWKNFS